MLAWFRKQRITIRAAIIGGLFVLAAGIISGALAIVAAIIPILTERLWPVRTPAFTELLPPQSSSIPTPPEAQPRSTTTVTPIPTPFPTDDILERPAPTPFAILLATNPEFAARLGFPKWPRPEWDPGVAYQEFEGGVMIYRSRVGPGKDIYVLLRDGTYLAFKDEWKDSMPPVPQELTPPPGFHQPIHGFGIVWSSNKDVRTSLGWATMCEISFHFVTQFFSDGFLMRVEEFIHYTPYVLPCTEDPADFLGKTYALLYAPQDQT